MLLPPADIVARLSHVAPLFSRRVCLYFDHSHEPHRTIPDNSA